MVDEYAPRCATATARFFFAAERGDEIGGGQQGRAGRLEGGPLKCDGLVHRRVGSTKRRVIRRSAIMAFAFRNELRMLPLRSGNKARMPWRNQSIVALPAQEDPAQHQPAAASGVRLGVSQCQGRAHGAAEHSQVRFQYPVRAAALPCPRSDRRGVVDEFAVWQSSAAAALVEQDDP